MLISRQGTRLSTAWYSKPTDTGLSMACHACAPTRYKRNIVEETIHRINQSTTTCQNFHKGLDKAERDWEANQYPPAFYGPIVRSTLEKIHDVCPIDAKEESTRCRVEPRDEVRPTICLQYRGRVSDVFARKLRNYADISTIFTTRKLRTCLPSLKCSFPRHLCSRVVYEICCPGCESCYVGQTARHLTTRLHEHMRKSTPVGAHLVECGVDAKTLEAKVIDSCLNLEKLLTREALHISRRKPGLNQREEYRQRQLTLRL